MSKLTMSAIVTATSLALAGAALAQQPPANPAPGQGQMNQNQMTPKPNAPMNTPAQNSGRVTEAQLRTNLQAQGYSQIDKVELKGNEYDVTAKKGTQSFKLTVDAMTGQVKSANPG